MGVYSSNRSHLGKYSSEEVAANENYMGTVGALQMTLEGYQNDQAIFEAVLGMDFQEAVAVNEGVEMEVFTEASAGGFAEKIKEFIKKAWEKIKGLFQTFLTKFNNVVMRDNKAFVEKYKKTVLTKDLSKMKYKWSEPKASALEGKGVTDAAGYVIDAINSVKSNAKDAIEKANNGDMLEEMLGEMINGSTDSKSFAKDFHEACFEDEDEIEGLSSARLSAIISLLSEKKVISNIEKTKKEVDKYFTKLLSDVTKESNRIAKMVPDKDNKSGDWSVNASASGKGNASTGSGKAADNVGTLNNIYKVVSVCQTGMNMYVGRYLDANKFEIKQARAVFAKAAAFNPKAVKESAIFVEAAGEAAEYEVMSSFEDYSL